LPADLLSRPAIAPPTSLPWWIVIVIECFGGGRPLTVGGGEGSDFIELGFTQGKRGCGFKVRVTVVMYH